MAEDTQEDLSMEDILSSIRNILMEDNANQQADQKEAESTPVPTANTVAEKPVETIIDEVEDVEEAPAEIAPEDILDLSASMIIDAPKALEPETVASEVEEDISFPDIEIGDEDIDFLSGLADLNTNQPSENAEIVQPDTDITSFLSEEDPTDASVMAEVAGEEEAYTDAEEETSFEVMDSPDLELNSFTDDDNAEPIFSPEEDNLPRNYNMEVENPVIEDEMVNLGIDEVDEEDSASALIDDSTLDEILSIHAQVEAEKTEELAKEEIKEELPEPVHDEVKEEVVKDDVVDVSANIISNFARMFADKQETKIQAEPVSNDVRSIPSMVCDNIAIGNGSLTLEEIVKDSVRAVVEKNLQSINNIATQEIHRQTKVWLDSNLASMVEAVVKQEIERVMVKVGR